MCLESDLEDSEESIGIGLGFFLTTTPLRDFLTSFFGADRGGRDGGFGLEAWPEPGMGGGLLRLLARAATALELHVRCGRNGEIEGRTV